MGRINTDSKDSRERGYGKKYFGSDDGGTVVDC